MTPAARHTETLSPTLRDLSNLCRVRRLFADYFEVRTTDNDHVYRVKAVWIGDIVFAKCSCPKATVRKEDCRHAESVRRFERFRVSSAQYGS